MANNKEMGVLVDKNDPNDAELFTDALNEVEFIIQNSQRFEVGAPKPAITKTEPQEKPATAKKVTGYCIRTGVEIPFNIDRPLSLKAYESWSKYEDEEYPEKYCHFSGEPSHGDTCFERPILKKNWNKAKEFMN